MRRTRRLREAGLDPDQDRLKQELALFAAKIDECDERLLGYLRDGPHTLDQLVARRLLYPLGFELPYVESAERRSIQMHLDGLVAAGQVSVVGDQTYALT